MIYIVGHKDKFKMYKQKDVRYLIVGKNHVIRKNFLYEKDGKNIIDRNEFYCELSGLYWIWKNDKEDMNSIIGLEHYRRFFIMNNSRLFFKFIDSKSAEIILKDYDIILSKAQKEENISMFDSYLQGDGHNHIANDIFILEKIIKENFQEYFDDFEYVMKKSKKCHMFNMFICKKELFDEYCAWLFSVLDLTYKSIDFSFRTGNQKRAIGYLGERLLNVWVYHKKLNVYECPVLFTKERNFLSLQIRYAFKKLLKYDK